MKGNNRVIGEREKKRERLLFVNIDLYMLKNREEKYYENGRKEKKEAFPFSLSGYHWCRPASLF